MINITVLDMELDSRFERADTPKTNAAQHNMGSVAEPHYVVDVEVARDLERELVAARAELAELREELNDRRKFAYAVEQALDGLKGDYVEIIAALRKEWVGLKDADFEKEKFVDYNFMAGARFAEAKLKEKNT